MTINHTGDEMKNNDAAVAAIKFALTDDGGCEAVTFLNLWLHGDFAAIRKEWANVPEDVFIGADPLAAAPTQPAPEAEPVAWMYSSSRGVDLVRRRFSDLEKKICPNDMTETPLIQQRPGKRSHLDLGEILTALNTDRKLVEKYDDLRNAAAWAVKQHQTSGGLVGLAMEKLGDELKKVDDSQAHTV